MFSDRSPTDKLVSYICLSRSYHLDQKIQSSINIKMKFASSLALVVLVATILTLHSVSGGESNRHLHKYQELCYEFTVRRTICDVLEAAANKGGDKSATFASQSRKACDKAEKLNEKRLEYVRQKRIQGAGECDSDEGYQRGLAVARNMVENIESGKVSGKLSNLLLS